MRRGEKFELNGIQYENFHFSISRLGKGDIFMEKMLRGLSAHNYCKKIMNWSTLSLTVH